MQPSDPPPEPSGPPAPEGSASPEAALRQERVGGRLSAGRRLARIAYRDPEHVAERLTLYGSQQVGEDSLAWAQGVQEERPDVPRGVIAEEVRIQTAQVARIDGAVSGTPFLIALVPGYLAYLWQEGVMERRIAALYGRDPRTLDTCAQILVLRGVHPTVDVASTELLKVRDAPLPEKPTARRPLRTWVRSIYVLLIFGGFLSASSDEGKKSGHWRLKAAVGVLIGGAIWVITWVLPVSFMIAMAWGCESHARSLGRRTLSFYGGESAGAEAAAGAGDTDENGGRTKRELVRGALLALSIVVPIAFVAYADHVRQSTGINWLGAVGALVAASLVIATTVIARRR